jgi:hypothetical protein
MVEVNPSLFSALSFFRGNQEMVARHRLGFPVDWKLAEGGDYQRDLTSQPTYPPPAKPFGMVVLQSSRSVDPLGSS